MKKFEVVWVKNIIVVIILTNFLSCKKTQKRLPDNVFYTCSMDPQVMEKEPGKCPICKMELTQITVDPKQKGIKLSEEQIELANVEVSKVELEMIGTEKVLSGSVMVNENLRSSISSRISGRIERLYFKNTGENIKRGAILYDIYSEELLVAEQDFLNGIEQQKLNLTSNQDYKDIVLASRNKLLLWGLTENQINKLAINKVPRATVYIQSKSEGVITDVKIREGDYITEGGSVFELANFSSLWIEAQLYSNEAANVLSFQDVSARIEGFSEIVSGRFSFISPQMLPGTKVSLARMELPNKNGLYKPGMEAFVTLSENRHQALCIDAGAILQDNKGASVWVRMPDGTFEKKMVKVGIQSDDKVEIIQGLAAGDEVVVSGAYLINSEYIFRKGADVSQNIL